MEAGEIGKGMVVGCMRAIPIYVENLDVEALATAVIAMAKVSNRMSILTENHIHQQRHAPEVQHRERRRGSLTATVSTIPETQYSSWYSADGRARAGLGRDSRLCTCQDILTHSFS